MEYDDPSITYSFPFPTIYQFPPFFTRQVNERTWHSQLVNWNSLILAYCRYYRIFTLDLSRTTNNTNNNNNNTKKRGEIDGELFWNRKINRALQAETIRAVFEYMVHHGTATWLDQPSSSNPNNRSPSSSSFDDFENLDSDNDVFEQFEKIFRNPLLSSSSSSTTNSNSTSGNRSCILVFWRQPQEWANLISEWIEMTGQNGSVLTLYELVEGDTAGSQEFRGLHPAILRSAIDILVQRGKAVIMKSLDGRIAGVKML